MYIPGISELVGKGSIPESLILITGPSGSGKTVYCRQFFADGLLEGSYCIYISSSLINKQFRNQFSDLKKLNLDQNSMFINPYLYNMPGDNRLPYLSSRSISLSDTKTEAQTTGYNVAETKTRQSDRSTTTGKLTMALTEVSNC